MASPEAHVAEQLKGIPGYREAFEKAFPGNRARSRSRLTSTAAKLGIWGGQLPLWAPANLAPR